MSEISQKAGYFGTFILSICNGLGITTAVISVAISVVAAQATGLSGAEISIPYGLQFLSLLMSTPLINLLIRNFGRKVIFMLTASLGVASGVLGFFSVLNGSISLLCSAHILLGIGLAGNNLFRFSAMDIVPKELKSTAMSLVVFGGTFAAILGPFLARKSIAEFTVAQTAYMAISAIYFLVIILLSQVNFPKPTKSSKSKSIGEANIKFNKLIQPSFIIGAGAASLGYGVMNLLMLSGSMAMLGCGITYNDSSTVIQWHVLAMFLPSIFMGRLIKYFGALPLIYLGLILQILSSLAGMYLNMDIFGFSVSLILLGLAWNVLYVCGSYYAVSKSSDDDKLFFQSSNEISIGIFAMLGAFLPGYFNEQYGWYQSNLIFVWLFAALALALSAYAGSKLISKRKISPTT